MASVYAYDQKIKDFRLFADEEQWKTHINVDGAASYLKEHLQKSLRDDFYLAYEAYNQKKENGYFALPRIIFPYVTFLGALLKGKNSSSNAVSYMNEYLSKVNSTYNDKKLCNFIYSVYRHGLAHTNMPKVMTENGRIFGWRIVFDDNQHLNVDRFPGIEGKSAILSISPNKLANEVTSSIDVYINDLRNGGILLDNFKKGFLSMAKVENVRAPEYVL